MKLSPKKCTFFQERVRYVHVGHIVSNKGIETDSEKTNKVINWPIPITPEKVRKYLVLSVITANSSEPEQHSKTFIRVNPHTNRE